MKKLAGLCVLVFLCGAVGAWADDWQKVADLTAVGDAKEVAVNKSVAEVKIRCTEGDVIINTVVVREGGKKTPHTLGLRLSKDNEHIINLGAKLNVTGLRISDGARGNYSVYVK